MKIGRLFLESLCKGDVVEWFDFLPGSVLHLIRPCDHYGEVSKIRNFPRRGRPAMGDSLRPYLA